MVLCYGYGSDVSWATNAPLLQVVLCQNHIQDQEWMDRTVAHELIHAFDHCRAKMDWNNCEHHACSEVSE